MLPRSFRPLSVRVLLLFGGSVAPLALSTLHGAESPPPIVTIAGVFAVWPELTTDDRRVELEGVVTGTMPNGAFRLHDGELGLYVTKSPEGRTLKAGERVAVSGVVRRGGFSPWVMLHAVRRLGRGDFPQAKPASYGVLASGAADNQWVEIEGVVRSVEVPEPRDFAVFDVGMAGGNLRVLVTWEPGVEYAALIDAAVRMRGTAAVNVNAHKHVVEPSFRVPSMEQITVVRPGQPDAFGQPLVPANRVMRFSPGAVLHHRVRTRGVVTRQLSATTFFVRDGEVGLKVETTQAQAVRPGQVVEVAGFPTVREGMAVLEHALCRGGTVELPPVPVEPTLTSLLQGTHNSDLVRVRARLVDWASADRKVTLILQSGDQLFKGLYNLPPNTRLSLPDRNSLVNVTGICVISELEDVWFYRPQSFLLLVADLADVELVQAPPWWTPERLMRALAIACAVLFAAAGWVWALRRQVERKRAVIEQQARHAAALEERSRIARELHDTLEQGLTGLSLQMKAMETDLEGAAHPVRSRLQSARQMLRQSRALARNAIREMRAEAVPARMEGLIEGLRRVADSWNQSGALTVSVRVTGAARPLPARVEQHLLGIGTEAMTNAVKHGRAVAIGVELDFGAAEVALRIVDNGVGFDPAQHLERASGCFGLLGMHERAREVQAELRIQSEPGRGAAISITVPLPAERPATATAETSSQVPVPLPRRAPAA